MKRLSIALAAIGISVSGLAALPATTDPTLVDVPLLPGGFFAGGSIFHLKTLPTNGDLDYASVNFGTSSAFFSKLEEVEPEFDWSWGINVGYVFEYTGNDINVSYSQYNTEETDQFPKSTSSPFSGFIFPVFNEVTGFGLLGPFITAASRVEYDIEQVDLTIGQYIDIGCRLIAHPYTGLRWSHINRDLESVFIGTLGTATALTSAPSYDIQESSDFDGIGPIAGIDASYYFCNGFGAVGHFDTALLLGNMDAKTNSLFLTTVSGAPGIANFFQFRADDNYRIAPVMDAKLGLDYTYVFNNGANSILTAEIGWQVSNYFNVADRLVTNINATGVFPGFFIFGRRTSDVGVHGPYISLVFHD